MAHRYWKLNITACAHPSYVAIAELELRESDGGADQTGSGTASASNQIWGAASNAVDDNTATYWQTSGTAPQWWSYDFGVGITKDIIQVVITPRGAGDWTRAPSAFDLQWSDNDSDWTTVESFTHTWTDANAVTFTVTAAIDIPVAAASITLTGYALTAVNPVNLSIGNASLTVAGYLPIIDINADVTIQLGNSSITVDGQAVSLLDTLVIGNASVNLTGYATEPNIFGIVEPGVSSISLTGQSLIVINQKIISIASSGLTVNGFNPLAATWGVVPEFEIAELAPTPEPGERHFPCGYWINDASENPEWEFVEQPALPFPYHKHPVKPEICGHWHKGPIDTDVDEGRLVPILRAFSTIGDLFVGWLVWYTGSIYDAPLFVAKDPSDPRGWEINEQDIADAIHTELHGTTGGTLELLNNRLTRAVGDLVYDEGEELQYCCTDDALYFDYSESHSLTEWNASAYSAAIGSPYEHKFTGTFQLAVGALDYPRVHTGSFYREFAAPASKSIWETVSALGETDVWYTTDKGFDNISMEVYSNKVHQLWGWGWHIVGGEVTQGQLCGGGWSSELKFGGDYGVTSRLLGGCSFPDIPAGMTHPEAPTGTIIGGDGEIEYTYIMINMWPAPLAPIFNLRQGEGLYYDFRAGRQFSLANDQWVAGETFRAADIYEFDQMFWDYRINVWGALPSIDRMDNVDWNYHSNHYQVGVKYTFSHKDGSTTEHVPQYGQGDHLKERTYLNNFTGSIPIPVPDPDSNYLLVDSSSQTYSSGRYAEILPELVVSDGANPEYLYFGSPIYWMHNRQGATYDIWSWLVYYNSITKVFESLGFNIPYANVYFTGSSASGKYGFYQEFQDTLSATYYVNLHEWEIQSSSYEQWAKAKRFVALYSDGTYSKPYGTSFTHSPVWEFSKQVKK